MDDRIFARSAVGTRHPSFEDLNIQTSALLKSTSVKKTTILTPFLGGFGHFGNGFLNFIITNLFTIRWERYQIISIYPYYSLVRDLIPIIITILIFVLITNQPAHNSQVDRPACVAWMSMVMRMKNENDFEIAD